MRQLRVLFAVAAVSLGAAACHPNDKSKDDAGGPRPWAFENRVDASGFAAKLEELRALLQRASPQLSLTPAALLTADSPMPSPPACIEPTATLRPDIAYGGESSAGGALALAPGTSCEDILASLGAFYARALQSSAQSVGRIAIMRADATICGMTVERAAIDPAVGAVGWKLVTPVASDAPSARTGSAGSALPQRPYEQTLYGGANDFAIGVMTTSRSSCEGGPAACGGAERMIVSVTTETYGDLLARRLAVVSDVKAEATYVDVASGGLDYIVASMRSASEVSGLGDGEMPRATERAVASVEGPAGTVRTDLTLTIEALAGEVTRLTGTVDRTPAFASAAGSIGASAGAKSFSVDLRGVAAACEVIPPDDADARDAEAQADAFGVASLPGDWVSACVRDGVGRFGYVSYEETLSLATDGRATHRLVPFTDSECFAGNETAVVELAGSYTSPGRLRDASGWSEVGELGLDYTWETFAVELRTASLVESFNAGAVCGARDWRLSERREFVAGTCFFDLGSYSLLNMYSLKRAHEFTAIRPENALVMDVARTSNFFGDAPEVRARTTSGMTKKLKKRL